MKVIIHKVERNSFVDKNDKTINYCKFYVLKHTNDTADVVGSDSVSYTTKYDNYDTLVNFYKLNKPVELTLNYKQVLNTGLYKEYVSKIDDVSL